jgi:hypothetical protein
MPLKPPGVLMYADTFLSLSWLGEPERSTHIAHERISMRIMTSCARYVGIATLSVGAFAVSAFAQQAAPPPDHLPAIQVAVALGTEVKKLCVERFPEIAPQVEQKFNAWPLSKVTIQILVNGKEYVSPFIQGLISQIREEFYRDDASKGETGCKEIDKLLDSFTRGAPPGALEPFIPVNSNP